eukprot:TRINITY_DN13022_c0_g1_i5.p1 TRINITY_DN13022_c0_g1~~TRINITY_DN13022_c0_g1_i5.p1  ORF type:complete len:233 (-),score=28.63 TRINITY_DN13022_c0_g1_i5:24-722(-)
MLKKKKNYKTSSSSNLSFLELCLFQHCNMAQAMDSGEDTQNLKIQDKVENLNRRVTAVEKDLTQTFIEVLQQIPSRLEQLLNNQEDLKRELRTVKADLERYISRDQTTKQLERLEDRLLWVEKKNDLWTEKVDDLRAHVRVLTEDRRRVDQPLVLGRPSDERGEIQRPSAKRSELGELKYVEDLTPESKRIRVEAQDTSTSRLIRPPSAQLRTQVTQFPEVDDKTPCTFMNT